MKNPRNSYKRILYTKIVEAVGGQIPDRWQREMFQDMVRKTRIVSVDELKGGGGWEVKGENVSRVIVGPRGDEYIGQIKIYVPKKTLEKLRGLKSKDPIIRREAEEALHSVTHEIAHNSFKAIDYEARMTRYFRDNPRVVENLLSRFLERGGKFRGINAIEKAKELVRQNPLFWSHYMAHTAHEAGADRMATEAVMQISRSRHAKYKDLEELTALRPFTVQEFARLQERSVAARKPRRSSRLERLARGIEYSSMRFMNQMGKAYRFTHDPVIPGRGGITSRRKIRGF